jgi:hypothetical protein
VKTSNLTKEYGAQKDEEGVDNNEGIAIKDNRREV